MPGAQESSTAGNYRKSAGRRSAPRRPGPQCVLDTCAASPCSRSLATIVLPGASFRCPAGPVALQQQRLQVVRPAEPPEHPRLVAGFNRHYAFTLVRLLSTGHSGLPLQHAQGALLLSCELRRRFSRCRCLNRCLNRRLWLALWGSRLSRHVLLRFVLAPRGPAPPFRFRRSVRSVRSVFLCSILKKWSRYNRNKQRRPAKPDDVAVQVGQAEARVP